MPACPVLARGILDPGGPPTDVGGTYGRGQSPFYACIITTVSTVCEPLVNKETPNVGSAGREPAGSKRRQR